MHGVPGRYDTVKRVRTVNRPTLPDTVEKSVLPPATIVTSDSPGLITHGTTASPVM